MTAKDEQSDKSGRQRQRDVGLQSILKPRVYTLKQNESVAPSSGDRRHSIAYDAAHPSIAEPPTAGRQKEGDSASSGDRRLLWLQNSTTKASIMIGAGGVTVLLLSLMTFLIADEFQPSDSVDLAIFEINPKPDDIPLLIERTPPQIDPIDVPPPPPVVDIVPTDRPSEPIIVPRQPHTDFDPFQYVVRTGREVVASDTDPQPLIRVPPTMPPRASRSGHCQMVFDVGSDGKPFNVAAPSCSDTVFARPATRAVGKWVYRPEVKDGLPVTQIGLTTIIRFRLTDDRGDIIPE